MVFSIAAHTGLQSPVSSAAPVVALVTASAAKSNGLIGMRVSFRQYARRAAGRTARARDAEETSIVRALQRPSTRAVPQDATCRIFTRTNKSGATLASRAAEACVPITDRRGAGDYCMP
jgi:hypothetical protein